MNSRERWKCALEHREPDRVPIHDSPWEATVERWRKEGLPPIEAGFSCLQPLEVKAGMDVRELKREYGDRLSFMGGIDVRLMRADDPNLIEKEIKDKFRVARKGGGYIYHSDHSIPHDVSFQQYKRVMELVRKYGRYD